MEMINMHIKMKMIGIWKNGFILHGKLISAGKFQKEFLPYSSYS